MWDSAVGLVSAGVSAEPPGAPSALFSLHLICVLLWEKHPFNVLNVCPGVYFSVCVVVHSPLAFTKYPVHASGGRWVHYRH